MAAQISPIPPLPANWEEVFLSEENEGKIDQALTLLKKTLPGRWNYDLMTKELLMHKMVRRPNSAGTATRGLRIFHRIVLVGTAQTALPPIDIAAFFFVRMHAVNLNVPNDAYCMTVGVKGDGSVTAAQLRQDLWDVCKHLQPQSQVATIEIVNAAGLPGDLPLQGGGAVLRAAFNSALAAPNVPPQPGQIKNPPDDISPGSTWPPQMKSWLLNP